MRKLVIALVLVCVMAAVWVPMVAQEAKALEGRYAASGINMDGTAYEVEVEVTTVEESKSFLRYLKDGNTIGIGLGIQRGDVLSVIFQTSDGATGLAAFTISGDTLVGDWLIPGEPGIGTEELKRVSGDVSIPEPPPPPSRQRPATTVPDQDTYKL